MKTPWVVRHFIKAETETWELAEVHVVKEGPRSSCPPDCVQRIMSLNHITANNIGTVKNEQLRGVVMTGGSLWWSQGWLFMGMPVLNGNKGKADNRRKRTVRETTEKWAKCTQGQSPHGTWRTPSTASSSLIESFWEMNVCKLPVEGHLNQALPVQLQTFPLKRCSVTWWFHSDSLWGDKLLLRTCGRESTASQVSRTQNKQTALLGISTHFNTHRHSKFSPDPKTYPLPPLLLIPFFHIRRPDTCQVFCIYYSIAAHLWDTHYHPIWWETKLRNMDNSPKLLRIRAVIF